MTPDRLTIVNCGDHYEAQAAAGGYACPAVPGHGTFENNQYLGLYLNLAVRQLGQLRGVVDIDPQTGLATVLWNNESATGLTDEALIEQARTLLQQMFPNETAVQRVFVLDELFKTAFHKGTPRGIRFRKTYRDVSSTGAADAQELALLLDGRTWDEFPR